MNDREDVSYPFVDEFAMKSESPSPERMREIIGLVVLPAELEVVNEPQLGRSWFREAYRTYMLRGRR